ncbi:MAG TPA: hypothetical protein VNG04_00335, partial [Candidatus Acidoferrum sp.]|nr:hypothetical protein [Candidatus Acidoferrum sp.]
TVKVTAVKSTTGLLPPGFTAVASKGVVTITVPGQKTNYSGTVTLILIDSDPCSTGGNCLSGSATVTIRV